MNRPWLPTALCVLMAAFQPLSVSAATAPQPLAAAGQAAPVDLGVRIDQQQQLVTKLDADLAANQQQQDQVTSALAEMARLHYQTRGVSAVGILHAGSVVEAWNRISEARLVATRETEAQLRLQALKQDQSAAKIQAEKLLTDLEAERQAAIAAANAAAQARLDAQIVSAQQVVARAVTGTSPGNHFAYGYCTWYVADHRPIPWFGDAIEWWGNARASGFAEGSVPRVGAIMVTRESAAGHVALVDSVRADGSWTVSEMNYVGWGVVSHRSIRPGQVSLVGFIY